MNVYNVRNLAGIVTAAEETKLNLQPLDQIINRLAIKKFEIIASLFLLSTLSLFVASAAISFILYGATAAFAILMFQAGKSANPVNNTELTKSEAVTAGQSDKAVQRYPAGPTVELKIADSKYSIDELTALERDFPQLCKTPPVFTTRDECLQYYLFIETLAERLNGLKLPKKRDASLKFVQQALDSLTNVLNALKKHSEDKLENAMPKYVKIIGVRSEVLNSQYELLKKSIQEIKLP